MALVTLPKLKCDRCEQLHDLTYYEDGSIRSSTHTKCSKPVPGPPNPQACTREGKQNSGGNGESLAGVAHVDNQLRGGTPTGSVGIAD